MYLAGVLINVFVYQLKFSSLPRATVKMSNNKIRTFDLSKVLAFMKYLVYLGFSFTLTKVLANLYMEV